MVTTFCLPRYRFPPTEQVIDQIVAFCRETIEAAQVPVLLGYSLGKAQEILCSLDGAGLTTMLHGSVYRMTRIYEQFGQSFCNYVRYNANEVAGKVLICPPSTNRSQMLEKIPHRRVAMISGWAVDPNAIHRYGVDAAFPLSDHAGYDDLIRYVGLVRPRRVFTLHGFAAEFASDLRMRGTEAWALTEENQMELDLGGRDIALRCPDGAARRPYRSPPQSEFLAFANIGEAIAATPAKLEQIRLSILAPREGEYVVKILTGDLRIGLREGLVEEAIAKAFDVPLEEVREANMLSGDIGQTALLASRKELHRAELSLFRPIKCMLATPQPTAEAVWERFAGATDTDRTAALSMRATVYLEDKFDGIRAQLHRAAQRVEIFSRDLRRITSQFPELADQARNFQEELIIDGEIIAFQEDRRLTFFDLQRRLGRTSDGTDLFARAAADVPVAFVIFDLLWLNGQSLVKTPLRERRRHLDGLRLPSHFQIARVIPAHSAAEIEQTFQQARQRLNEGLMIKDPESFYLPGTRGMFWFKLKKELATLDVVVVAAELGHGKRNNVLSDYTFAVRDEATGELLPIGKAYSGLTDEEIAELTEHFKQNTIADLGRYRKVKPNVVLEVAFNSIQPSTRHASGLALRFPRIKAIRRDKNVDSIDTLQYARDLAEQRANSPAGS